MAYDSDFVTLQGEMLRQVRRAVAKLAACRNEDLSEEIKQSIAILTGTFACRIGTDIDSARKSSGD